MLPYGDLNLSGVRDARIILNHLGIPERNCESIDIKPAVEAVLGSSSGVNDLRGGNIMARMRMIYIYDRAKQLNALVCGTENRTEYCLGYFTRFGDEASDLEPIQSLYKTQVWELARYLDLPKLIIDKAPAADLWAGQTDEIELGFNYETADKILYYTYENKLTPEQIVEKGLKKEIVNKVLTRVKNNEFKHILPFTLE